MGAFSPFGCNSTINMIRCDVAALRRSVPLLSGEGTPRGKSLRLQAHMQLLCGSANMSGRRCVDKLEYRCTTSCYGPVLECIIHQCGPLVLVRMTALSLSGRPPECCHPQNQSQKVTSPQQRGSGACDGARSSARFGPCACADREKKIKRNLPARAGGGLFQPCAYRRGSPRSPALRCMCKDGGTWVHVHGHERRLLASTATLSTAYGR